MQDPLSVSHSQLSLTGNQAQRMTQTHPLKIMKPSTKLKTLKHNSRMDHKELRQVIQVPSNDQSVERNASIRTPEQIRECDEFGHVDDGFKRLVDFYKSTASADRQAVNSR